MLEPLGRFLALSPQACTLGPAHLIHCLIQMAGDMEAIQHVQCLTGLSCDNLLMVSSPLEGKWRGANNAEESRRTPIFAGLRANLLTIISPLLRSEFEPFQQPALAFPAAVVGSLTERSIFSRAFHWDSTRDASRIP